jgi:glycosyltransferase involved in cell wall biosynthesis
LVDAVAAAGVRWPIIVVGEGPQRAALEADARARGLDLRVIGWRDRQEVWAWMRHATLLAFPSYGPESLSRVLIEAAALGTPIAAMNTGGTTDILKHDVTGLVADDVAAFSRALARLAGDAALRARLGAAASADVHARFSAPAVVERIEQVYRGLLGERVA